VAVARPDGAPILPGFVPPAHEELSTAVEVSEKVPEAFVVGFQLASS
jgi:hypothetical protein